MTHDPMHNMQPESEIISLTMVMIWIIFVAGYTIMAIVSNQKYKHWPFYRCLCWYMGCSCILIVTAGPLAQAAHIDFRIHMIAHLLLGMLAPLLLALSAPLTLLLRSLSVHQARMISRILRSSVSSFICHPIVAALLNIGGLWMLYTTSLYMWMHQYIWVNLLVHVHILLAGYVFTIAILYVDLAAHRHSHICRAIVLVTAGALHSILAKLIYAYPPTGVQEGEAQTGALWMYYGGDLIQLLIIILFCYQWYQSVRCTKVKTNVRSSITSV